MARLFAAAARFGAYPAVIHVRGVPLALFGAYSARFGACPEGVRGHAGVSGEFAGYDASRRGAKVGAREVEAYARDEFVLVLLPDARVGARHAALLAIEARLDALRHEVGVDRDRAGGVLEHFTDVVHVDSFPRKEPRRRKALAGVGHVLYGETALKSRS